MKNFFRLLAIAIAIATVSIGFHMGSAEAKSNNGTSKTVLDTCGETGDYLFALCAATTCTDTGKRVAVNTPSGGKRYFKEVKCSCPVVNTNSTSSGLSGILAQAYPTSKPAIANLNGGNMKGNCAYPNSAAGPAGGIWSLYSLVSQFPQQTALPTVQNPDPTWAVQPAKFNRCAASLNQGREFANCFSFKCGAPYLNNQGVLVSDCSCPKGEDVFSALPVPAATTFITPAGGNETDPVKKNQYCYAHPVGGF